MKPAYFWSNFNIKHPSESDNKYTGDSHQSFSDICWTRCRPGTHVDQTLSRISLQSVQRRTDQQWTGTVETTVRGAEGRGPSRWRETVASETHNNGGSEWVYFPASHRNVSATFGDKTSELRSQRKKKRKRRTEVLGGEGLGQRLWPFSSFHIKSIIISSKSFISIILFSISK